MSKVTMMGSVPSVTSLPIVSTVDSAVTNGMLLERHHVLHCVLADETKTGGRVIERACRNVSMAHSAQR